MLVVETHDGVAEYNGEAKEEDVPEWPAEYKDDEMKEFILTNKLSDVQQHLLQSQFTIQHLREFNYADGGDSLLNEICDQEWHLRPTQKHRLKYAIASLNSETRTIKKKIVMIGGTGVGKTSILWALKNGSCESSPDLTIGTEFGKIKMSINQRVFINFNVFDIAGQEAFRDLATAWFRGSDAIFIVYDLTNERTFEEVSRRLHTVNNHAGSSKILLIGNKLDLIHRRSVGVGTAKRFAIERRLPLLELSAKNGQNIDSLRQWMRESLDISLREQDAIRLDDALLNKQDGQRKRKCC